MPETSAQPGKKKEPLDINSASADELKPVSALGEAYLKKAVENQPYQRKDELMQNELMQKKIVPQVTYEKIKAQLVAKRPPAK